MRERGTRSSPTFKLLEDAFQPTQDFLHRGCFNRFNGVTTSVVKGLNNLGHGCWHLPLMPGFDGFYQRFNIL